MTLEEAKEALEDAARDYCRAEAESVVYAVEYQDRDGRWIELHRYDRLEDAREGAEMGWTDSPARVVEISRRVVG